MVIEPDYKKPRSPICWLNAALESQNLANWKICKTLNNMPGFFITKRTSVKNNPYHLHLL